MTTRVIGLGSDLSGDDGAGLAAARSLRQTSEGTLDVRTCAGDLASLLAAWEGADTVILIDTVATGAPAGTIHRVELDGLAPRTVSTGSTHDTGLAHAVLLAEALGRLPTRLVIVGIEGVCFDVGAPLSVEVAQAVKRVCTLIEEIAHRCGAESP
jgi:hydrogenase maturation protease